MCTLTYRFCLLAMLVVGTGFWFEARGQSTEVRNLEVLTLDQAISIALRGNPQVKNAGLDIGRTGEQLAALKTRRLPSFNVDIFGSQQLTPIDFTFERGVFGTYPGIGPIPAENTKLSTPLKPTAIFITRVSQPLSQLYRTNLNLNQLRLSGEIAQEELRSKQQRVIRDVKRAYFALLQTQSALEAGRETIRMYKELDRVTGDYLAQQVVLRSESLDVKSRLARSEYDTMVLADQASTQKQQLNLLLGRDVRTEFTVTTELQPDSVEYDLAAAQKRALERRPDIREARLKLKQAEGDRRIKKAEYIPDISATFQHIATANYNNLIPKSYMNIGVTVTWEIFDWGRKKHELAEKDMVTQQARNSIRDAENAILIEVADKFNKLRQARQLLTVIQIGRESAVEAVRVSTNRYKVQMSLLSDVLQAQARREQANDQQRQALLALWTAQTELETALGEEK